MAHPTVLLDGGSVQDVPRPIKLSFRKRDAEQLTQVEKQHMEASPKQLFFLHSPPVFYASGEDCDEEIHKVHVLKWSTFLIVETLLAAMAIQPLVAAVNMKGWKYDVYGVLWTQTLIGSFFGLIVNAVILGHLLHCPRNLAWIWMCEVGNVSEIPIVFMWISALMSLLAMGYTTWILYGLKVGIPCIVAGLGSLAVTIWLMRRLKRALQVTYKPD